MDAKGASTREESEPNVKMGHFKLGERDFTIKEGTLIENETTKHVTM